MSRPATFDQDQKRVAAVRNKLQSRRRTNAIALTLLLAAMAFGFGRSGFSIRR